MSELTPEQILALDELGGFSLKQAGAISKLIYQNELLLYLEAEVRQLREDVDRLQADNTDLRTQLAKNVKSVSGRVSVYKPNLAVQVVREVAKRYIEETGGGGDGAKRSVCRRELIVDLSHPVLQQRFEDRGLNYLILKERVKSSKLWRAVRAPDRQHMNWTKPFPHAVVLAWD